MTLTIFADENIPGVEQFLGDAAQVQRFSGRSLQGRLLTDADALLVRSVTRVDSNLLAGSRVKFVGSATSGFDHVDRLYLDSTAIRFAHAPGSNANSVVEYVLSAIAAHEDFLERLFAGGSVGIVGYGHVGKLLAIRLNNLGIACLVHDPWLDQATIAGAAPLEELLRCDVISVHCALTEEQPWPSRHLLGASELAQIAGDTLLINASRGGVIDEQALMARLQRAPFPVILDVWEGEPAVNPALLRAVVFGTAHIAGYSADGKALATRMLCTELADCLALQDIPGLSSLAPAPAIEVPAGLAGAALARFVIHRRYDIRRDDQWLRQGYLAADSDAAQQHFDRLRREYPQRRELSGSEIIARNLSGKDQALLAALECEPSPDTGRP